MGIVVFENDYGYNGRKQAEKPRGKDFLLAKGKKPPKRKAQVFINSRKKEELIKKIKQKFGSINKFCRAIGYSEMSVRNFLNGKPTVSEQTANAIMESLEND